MVRWGLRRIPDASNHPLPAAGHRPPTTITSSHHHCLCAIFFGAKSKVNRKERRETSKSKTTLPPEYILTGRQQDGWACFNRCNHAANLLFRPTKVIHTLQPRRPCRANIALDISRQSQHHLYFSSLSKFLLFPPTPPCAYLTHL